MKEFKIDVNLYIDKIYHITMLMPIMLIISATTTSGRPLPSSKREAEEVLGKSIFLEISQYYDTPLVISENGLGVINEVFGPIPFMEDLINEVSIYNLKTNHDRKQLLSDYPQILDFMPILTFSEEKTGSGSINGSFQKKNNSNLLNLSANLKIRNKHGAFISIERSDLKTKVKKRFMQIKFHHPRCKITVGNFNFYPTHGLLFGKTSKGCGTFKIPENYSKNGLKIDFGTTKAKLTIWGNLKTNFKSGGATIGIKAGKTIHIENSVILLKDSLRNDTTVSFFSKIAYSAEGYSALLECGMENSNPCKFPFKVEFSKRNPNKKISAEMYFFPPKYYNPYSRLNSDSSDFSSILANIVLSKTFKNIHSNNSINISKVNNSYKTNAGIIISFSGKIPFTINYSLYRNSSTAYTSQNINGEIEKKISSIYNLKARQSISIKNDNLYSKNFTLVNNLQYKFSETVISTTLISYQTNKKSLEISLAQNFSVSNRFETSLKISFFHYCQTENRGALYGKVHIVF